MDVMEQCGRITGDIDRSKVSRDQSQVDVTAALTAITAAEKALRDAHSYIEIEGQVSTNTLLYKYHRIVFYFIIIAHRYCINITELFIYFINSSADKCQN